MHIRILDKIQKLQSVAYNYDRDHAELTELYQILLEYCSDKDNFIAQSANTMALLTENKLQDADEKKWLHYVNEIFASYLAVQLYGEKNITSTKELEKIEAYFRHGNLQIEIASIGLYACAQMLTITAPMKCYALTKEAFTMNPYLGSFLNVTYCYDKTTPESNLTTNCPICGSDDSTPHYCSPQILKLNHNTKFPPAKLWMKCNGCNNYYTYEFPLSEVGEINGHYTKNHKTEILENRFPLQIYNDIFRQFTELTQGHDYLEIGIGNGEMLAVAQEFGYHVDAVEICKEDCEKVSSVLDINIQWCDIVSYETEQKYDVIVMGDVFEHVTRPLQVLMKVKNMLKKDGVLWLSTPNYNCAYARMQHFNHAMWHELNHYTYVSLETMRELLHDIDMEIIRYDMSRRYIGSMELFIKVKNQ